MLLTTPRPSLVSTLVADDPNKETSEDDNDDDDDDEPPNNEVESVYHHKPHTIVSHIINYHMNHLPFECFGCFWKLV